MPCYDFNSIVERSGSLSVKYAPRAIESICNNAHAQPFWVADMDFAVAMEISQAIAEQAAHGVLGYPLFSSLREEFFDWAMMRHQWGPDINRIAIGPGMLTTLALLLDLYTKRGDAVIVPMPAYRPFVQMVRENKRTLVEWHFTYDSKQHRFTIDSNQLEHLIREHHPGTLIFCSPHNPSGRVFSYEELNEVAYLAAKYQIVVISDEIHADLAYPGFKHIPFDTVALENGCRAVTCMAPSKTFNIPGEHYCNAVFTDSDLAKGFITRLHSLFLGTGLFSTVAASAAYRYGYDWLMQLIEYLDVQAHHIEEVLRPSPIRCIVPEASFIGFIDCSAIVESVAIDATRKPDLYDPAGSPHGGLLSRFFGQRAGIAMNDGSWFGSDYGSFVRFNFGTSRKRVDMALSRMLEAVDRLD